MVIARKVTGCPRCNQQLSNGKCWNPHCILGGVQIDPIEHGKLTAVTQTDALDRNVANEVATILEVSAEYELEKAIRITLQSMKTYMHKLEFSTCGLVVIGMVQMAMPDASAPMIMDTLWRVTGHPLHTHWLDACDKHGVRH